MTKPKSKQTPAT